MDELHKPLQMINSFEGLINGLVGHDDVASHGQVETYDLSNFEQRVQAELSKLKELGIGGVLINCGYADEYLFSEAGWQRFVTGLRIAVDMELRIWIWDEKGYPSGTAGGRVLEGHPELEAVGMKRLLLEAPAAPATLTLPDPRAELYAAYAISKDAQHEQLPGNTGGRLVTIPEGNFRAVDIYFIAPLFEGTHAATNLSGARRYINALDKRAVSRFLHLTHANYHQHIPADLWQHIEAFFVDEPSLLGYAMEKGASSIQEDSVDASLPVYPAVPWCDDLEAEFLNEHRYALSSQVPSLFAGNDERDRKVRRNFWATVARLYSSAFAGQVADVCQALGVDFTGHLLGEETIWQQVILHGSLIQTLKQFHRPGIDLLSGRVDLFENHLLTHKAAISASFFGSGKGLASETSDYFECWHGDQTGAPLDEIHCTLALQYLLGVRDFCLCFLIPRFPPGVYEELCAFTTRLHKLGVGQGYQPECALYYPIEKAWESYLPSCPSGDVHGAGIFARTVAEEPAELKALCRLTTTTVQRLFSANIQYVLCERQDIGRLRQRGITTLVYYGPGEPDGDLPELCEQAGVSLVTLDDFEQRRTQVSDVEAGPNVVYATYDGFVFAVNMGRESSHLTLPHSMNAVFPLSSGERQRVSGSVELPPMGCAFFFEE